MSATMKTNASEGGCIAQLNFRVRCETLGHGESVYLVSSDDPDLTRVRVRIANSDCFKPCTVPIPVET